MKPQKFIIGPANTSIVTRHNSHQVAIRNLQIRDFELIVVIHQQLSADGCRQTGFQSRFEKLVVLLGSGVRRMNTVSVQEHEERALVVVILQPGKRPVQTDLLDDPFSPLGLYRLLRYPIGFTVKIETAAEPELGADIATTHEGDIQITGLLQVGRKRRNVGRQFGGGRIVRAGQVIQYVRVVPRQHRFVRGERPPGLGIGIRENYAFAGGPV